MQILFLIAASAFGAILLVWIGYPVGVWVVSLVAGRPLRLAPVEQPADTRVTAILTTREPADQVTARVRNLLDSAWPADRLDVVVALDARSANATVSELSAIDPRVRVIVGDQPGGKASSLNAAVREARGDVLVMADTAQRFDRDTIPVLVASLGDIRFGAVSGALMLASNGLASLPIRLYWQMEKWLRSREAVIHSSVGVTGAVYAIRRSLWPIVPDGILLDDLYVPMTLVMRGHRVGFTHAARAYEQRVFSAAQEQTRKTRTMTGILQLSGSIPGLFSPRRNPVLVQMLVHKHARLLTPLLLTVGVLAGGIWLLAQVTLGPAALVVGGIVVVLALMVSPLRRGLVSIAGWAYHMQLATVRAVRNAASARWDVWSR